MSWFRGLRARLRLLLDRRTAESRMDEEIRFHIGMETERLVREGVDPKEARRRALVAFGGVERTKEEMRSGRGLAWLSGLRLDLKLGVRMLLKYPVMAVASVLALTVAVTLAVSWFEFMTDLTRPRLPFEESDRIVSISNRDLATADQDFPSEPRSLHDFETWRDELESIEDLAAASSAEYTVTTEDGRLETLMGARVTPSMFDVTRVQPLLGRTLTDEDDRAAAEPAVVLGHGAWQRLFDGDRSAIGRTVRLGSEHATVVGIMPEDFGFPVNHELWTPLRENALSYERRQGPAIRIVGRLAPGATLKRAQAELATFGQRAAAEFPDTHEHLRPEVYRFARRGGWESRIAVALNLPFLLFLIVVCTNVATLLFARTATRESEIAMRSALGASRRRIIAQLVAEALVLTSLAGGLGLAAAHWGLRWGMDLFWEVQQMRPPFWFDSGLSASTAAYVCVLAVLAALVIGGIPGLRATGRRLRDRLTQLGTGGSEMRFGPVATGVIVVQVALCVAFIPVAIMTGQELLPDVRASDFPAEEYLSGRLTRQLDPRGAEPGPEAGEPEERDEREVEERRSAELFNEAYRLLASEPGVVAATRASRLPGFNHPTRAVEIEGDSARILRVRTVAVDPDFFDVMDARIVSGRSFGQGDVEAAGVAIVDEGWAQETFGARSPVGRRIRYPSREGEEGRVWHEIVGVVAGAERAVGPGEDVAIFHPLQPEERASVQIYLRTAGLPAALVPEVHAVATSLDPGLGVVELKPLENVWRPVERADVFFTVALGVIAGIILLFALIGIYALMSFAVARRAREIGIRTALGAGPGRIITAIFSRAMVQLGVGIVAGAALVSLTFARSPEGFRLVGAVALAMVVVGLLGCVVPARRALRIEPTDALRAE